METVNVSKRKNWLLPVYFKKIGIILITLSVIFLIRAPRFYASTASQYHTLFNAMVVNLFLVGLFFISWARDKVEDELKGVLRIRAMITALAFGISTVIIDPFIDILFRDPITELNGRVVVLNMLGFYLLIFNYFKWRAFK